MRTGGRGEKGAYLHRVRAKDVWSGVVWNNIVFFPPAGSAGKKKQKRLINLPNKTKKIKGDLHLFPFQNTGTNLVHDPYFISPNYIFFPFFLSYSIKHANHQ